MSRGLILFISMLIQVFSKLNSLGVRNAFHSTRYITRSTMAKNSFSAGNTGKDVVDRRITFVLGGPGSGKGTQCEKLCEEFMIKHLSAGALLREEQMKPTPEGKLIDSYLKEGRIVPVDISLGLLKKAVVDLNCDRYVIDGFPRNWDNLEGWNKEMGDVCELESVLFIDCDEATMEKRILERGKASGRDDDNLQSVRKRFETFKRETIPVVEHFKKEHAMKFHSVSGDGSIDDCYADFRRPLLRNLEAQLIEMTQEDVIRRNKEWEDQSASKTRTQRLITDPAVELAGRFAEVTYKVIEEKLDHDGNAISQRVLPGKRKDTCLTHRNGRWEVF